jgi:hypothetical protein
MVQNLLFLTSLQKHNLCNYKILSQLMKDNVKTIRIFQNPLHGLGCDSPQKQLMLSHIEQR